MSLTATDRCVKCGLCLPHCPTFSLTGNEADSPRGRISLMQMLDQPQPTLSPGLFLHLDQCLQCRACEAMCPSKVPFGELMDTTRSKLETLRTRPLVASMLRKLGLALLGKPAGLRVARWLIHLYQQIGLQRLVAHLPLPATIKRLNHLLPDCGSGKPGRTLISSSSCSVPDAPQTCTKMINLFPGCTGHLFDQHTITASITLLSQLGYKVHIPDKATCCGALHQHNGEPATAAALASSNASLFADNNAPILVMATGCSAHLIEYAHLYKDTEYLPGNRPSTATLSSRIHDITSFIAQTDQAALPLQPLHEKVAVYIPCTLRNVLKQQQNVLDLLGWVPGIELVVVNPQGGCCGAAGSYMLSQPTLSDQLRDQVIRQIIETGARTVVTSNIGCSIQLQAGLKAQNPGVEVLHPVTLLERQLIQ